MELRRRNRTIFYNDRFPCSQMSAMDLECEHSHPCANKIITNWLLLDPRHRPARYIIEKILLDNKDYFQVKSSKHIKKGEIVLVAKVGKPNVKDASVYQVFYDGQDYEMTGDACFFDSSCKPNIQMKVKSIGNDVYASFETIKYVRPDRKLTFDYRANPLSALGRTICECRCNGCRFTIGGTGRRGKKSHNYKCSIRGCKRYSRGGKQGTCKNHEVV